MNKIGIDYFTFGDHEFDIYTGAQHLARLAETEFPMISSNVFAGENTPLPNVQVNDIFTVTNTTGKSLRVGIFGVTEPIPRSAVPISYTNHISATAEQVALLDPQVDVLIALTHFGVAVDQDTAQRFPAIDLILGGDDHEHMKVEAGPGLATIFKADSNVRSVQVIDLYYNVVSDTLRIEDRLQPITDALANDPTTQAEVDKWARIGFDGFREQGIEPTEVVAVPTVDLDGFANSIRNDPTAFTRLMVNGINATATEPELSLMFSALIRMDDLIPAAGDFTMYDVIRTFPNNFDIVSVTIPGAALKGILSFGKQSAGSGQFILYTDNVTQDNDGNWLVDGEAVEDTRIYRAGTTAELAAGFATFGVTVSEPHDRNLQELLIQQLRTEFPRTFTIFLPNVSQSNVTR
jgi:5'-nucleotidase